MDDPAAYCWTYATDHLDPLIIVIFLGCIALYALIHLLIRPFQGRKRFRELYPEGMPVVYAFYGDRMKIHSVTAISDQTARLPYADVQRKIKETKHWIRLSTARKNRIYLYKAIMTPEEAERVRRLLNERCPQRKTGK